MNRYSLETEGRRWWWPSAAVGAVGAAAVASILVLSSSSQAAPVHAPQSDGAGVIQSTTGTSPERPCFLWRAHWNQALDGPQPTCPLPTSAPAAVSVDRAVLRSWLDYLP